MRQKKPSELGFEGFFSHPIERIHRRGIRDEDSEKDVSELFYIWRIDFVFVFICAP